MAEDPWWFHPKLYQVVLYASFIFWLVFPSPVIFGFLLIWISYGIVVGVLGLKNMARRRRLPNSA